MSEEVNEPQAETPQEPSFEIEKNQNAIIAEKVVSPDTPKEEKKDETLNDNDPKEEVGTEDQPKKKSRGQKRIENLAREKRDLAKRVEELEAERDGKKSESAELNPDDYEDYDDYLDAVTNQKESKPKKPTKQESSKKADDFQIVLDDIEVKFDETRDKYKDFDELVQRQPDDGGPHVTMSMVEAMNAVDNSGEIAYALAKDINDSIRISKLSPIKQVLAIQKLSDKLAKTENKDAKVTKKVTSAPEPINAIGGGEIIQKTLADAGSYTDYEGMRTQENASKDGW